MDSGVSLRLKPRLRVWGCIVFYVVWVFGHWRSSETRTSRGDHKELRRVQYHLYVKTSHIRGKRSRARITEAREGSICEPRAKHALAPTQIMSVVSPSNTHHQRGSLEQLLIHMPHQTPPVLTANPEWVPAGCIMSGAARRRPGETLRPIVGAPYL